MLGNKKNPSARPTDFFCSLFTQFIGVVFFQAKGHFMGLIDKVND